MRRTFFLGSSASAEPIALGPRLGLRAEALHPFKETTIEALLGSQRRQQAVLGSIDDGLLILDRLGRLEHSNPVARRLLGWDVEPVGLSLGAALGQPRLDEVVRQVLDNEPPAGPPEDLAIEVGGERRLLAWRLNPVSHADGRVLGAVMVLHNVTDQRAFERVRDEFVLRASHELRTPITSMHMAFSLLRESLHFPPETREHELLCTLDQEMRRLLHLVDELLDFSRYQSGKQTLELQPCNIGELLERARQRFTGQADSQAVSLELKVQSPLPSLLLDPGLMERLLDNLLGNALRHTPAGGWVRLQASRDEKGVILAVEDNGEGIPFSEQDRICEPFVRVGRKPGGAGLGLALCKEIAQLHGGHLGIRSQLGQGTRVHVRLPLSFTSSRSEEL